MNWAIRLVVQTESAARVFSEGGVKGQGPLARLARRVVVAELGLAHRHESRPYEEEGVTSSFQVSEPGPVVTATIVVDGEPKVVPAPLRHASSDGLPDQRDALVPVVG